MDVIVFSNPKTAAAFEALTQYDPWIEVPPGKKDCNCRTYTGKLSDITPCAAGRYVDSGGNLLKRKEVPAVSDQEKEIIGSVDAEEE